MTKNKKNSLKIEIFEVLYSLAMFLTALGVLKFPEFIFNVLNGAMLLVLLLATIAWIIAAFRSPMELALAYRRQNEKKNFSIKRIFFLSTIFVCLVGWSKTGPTFEFILYMLCTVSSAVNIMQYLFKKNYYLI
jgi:hypothetical protein